MAQEPLRKPSLLGLYYSVPEAAEKLLFSDDTIRKHLVPMSEYEEGRGDVPYVLIGTQKKVPRWWLQRRIDDAFDGPGQTTESE